ncbi:CDP-alcohol phosphatidyltransferase family protein [Methanospirillum lacunae]|uniref:CDP-alcohol phosphatidyltransferase family protein n=1 Tax=Methanospirillum lacunae TaxID=668570 RepID=A0A2V2MQV8_9EURY|nr:CDP-alcohol phosphatidyltransferase family protein [Methanospirillum lacunae]PWR70532.1 CDP-alcohol phosphatidyltransferase family protein [Methanospirillum lacunae]
MTLDSYRAQVKPFIDPVVSATVRIGLTPNFCTILSLIAAAGGGYAFFRGDILFGTFGVILNAFFDGLDGAMARALGQQGLRGDFLDHTVDRYADIFILCGIFSGPLCAWWIGIFGLTGVLMSSYMGTQAQAVGVGRFYGGLLGRADRLVLLMGVCIASLFIPAEILGLSLFAWLLLIFGIFGHVTAAQRFAHVWKQLP